MKRRLLLVSASAIHLVGCASKKTKAQLKPNELRSMGMLPIKEWVDNGSTAQFSLVANPVPASMAGAPPPVTPGLLGMALGQSIRAGRDAERAALANALSAVAFDPRETLRPRSKANSFVGRSPSRQSRMARWLGVCATTR